MSAGSSHSHGNCELCDQLASELAAAQADAERYRHWRYAIVLDNNSQGQHMTDWVLKVIDASTEDAVDAAIDAALKEQKP